MKIATDKEIARNIPDLGYIPVPASPQAGVWNSFELKAVSCYDSH
jgi:hypothetical protein